MGDTTDLVPSDAWASALALLAVTSVGHGDIDPADPVLEALAAKPIQDIIHAKHSLSEVRQAIGRVAGLVDEMIAADIRRNGPLRLGDSLYTTTRTSSRKVLPQMADALFDYLGEDLRRCVNPSAVKITGVRTVAELRGDSPKAVEDTFYKRDINTEPELAVVPVAQCQWAQRLKDGERGHP